MKFIINERKLHVAPEIREYAEKKISKLDRFFSDESEASVMFSAERGRHITELTVSNRGLVLRVTEATGDMRASIDSAVASVERQIRKHKTRLAKRLRDGAFEREAAPTVTVENDEDEAEPEFNIVRVKSFPLKPMTPEEAVLQMNLLGHTFFVFKNQSNSDTFSVVYKRRGGDYGMIESA
ncbi:MAG: ribosome-associated translation inhibitor RaiA [Oscillospiraceae bacterium]|jgi:putative sigma-54 modulation protein|nr:ribosome-associated translation inhibitor RaiA [Oscillospiraceae bacterium]